MTDFAAPLSEYLPASLTRRDLLVFERMLRSDLATVLSFEAHALYFPTEDEIADPIWLEEEEKLLLPLRRAGALLGVLLLRRPDTTRLPTLLPHLPAVVSLCLDKLALYKRGRTDTLTGLAIRDVLLDRLTGEIRRARQFFTPANTFPMAPGPEQNTDTEPYQVCLSVTVLRLSGLRTVAHEHGHSMAQKLLCALGAALRDALPDEALAARSGDGEFAVFLPGGTRQSTEETARIWIQSLGATHLPGILGSARVKVQAGYALFPQDWEAWREGREPDEAGVTGEAQSLFEKARLAALRADNAVLGYGQILSSSGRVENILPLSRLRITLGRDVGAREGQRFTRESPSGSEIMLTDVREDFSEAEILLPGDPAHPLRVGDRLVLLPDSDVWDVGTESTPALPDPVTGLFRYGDFLTHLALAREKHPSFGLVLLRFAGLPSDSNLTEVFRLFRRLGKLMAGRYSQNAILLFHPDLQAEEAWRVYPPLAEELAQMLGQPPAMGIVCLPWLSYRAPDALECCRKALEYAMLLPAPHVGVFDSLAINISADKRYSQGDTFGAMKEYEMALLADATNILARNSLGVCLAGLGRHAEARGAFEEVVALKPDDAAGQYNLGTVYASLGEREEAVARFRACLDSVQKDEPAGLYPLACIRLGELAETVDETGACYWYNRARDADPASPLPYRCLARLEWGDQRPDKARELLHQALERNPGDAFSLHLLASLYLDGGEDPKLAESLARQSLALRPDRKVAWLELARALDAQGRVDEARKTRSRAGAR